MARILHGLCHFHTVAHPSHIVIKYDGNTTDKYIRRRRFDGKFRRISVVFDTIKEYGEYRESPEQRNVIGGDKKSKNTIIPSYVRRL